MPKPSSPARTSHRHSAAGAAIAVAMGALLLVPVAAAEASPVPYGMIAGATAPLIARLQASAQQQQEPERPPPVVDPADGPVFSIMGGSVFSGSSAFQAGAAFAYFFGAKANFGFEVEGTATLGPGGRVGQGMGSFVLQAGARTSKFVPYLAFGGGYLQAKTNLPKATREVLDSLGIRPEPTSETAPLVQFGGGVRFYVRPNLAFRADVRFAQVILDLDAERFSDRLFPMRRLAGMISWDF